MGEFTLYPTQSIIKNTLITWSVGYKCWNMVVILVNACARWCPFLFEMNSNKWLACGKMRAPICMTDRIRLVFIHIWTLNWNKYDEKLAKLPINYASVGVLTMLYGQNIETVSRYSLNWINWYRSDHDFGSNGVQSIQYKNTLNCSTGFDDGLSHAAASFTHNNNRFAI